MIKNTFTQLVNHWSEFDKQKKLDLLSRLEFENANFQNRMPRILVETENIEDFALACYSPLNPERISIKPLTNQSVITLIEAVLHEGFHAMVDDYFNNKADLKCFSKIDKSKLHHEKAYSHLIHYRAQLQDAKWQFALSFYEEVLAREESMLQLVNLFLNSFETEYDYYMHHKEVLFPFVCIVARDRAIEAEDARGKNYDIIKHHAMIFDAYRFPTFVVKVDTKKKIKDEINPRLNQFFKDNLELFINSKNEKTPHQKILDNYLTETQIHMEK